MDKRFSKTETECQQLQVQLKNIGTDEGLNLLADAFVAGMQQGVHTAIHDQLTQGRVSAVICRFDDQLIQKLCGYLREPESVEFAEMDQVINDTVLENNPVSDWDMLLEQQTITLQCENLATAFVSGWQFGMQNAIFSDSDQNTTSERYVRSQRLAEQMLGQYQLDQFELPATQQYLDAQLAEVVRNHVRAINQC